MTSYIQGVKNAKQGVKPTEAITPEKLLALKKEILGNFSLFISKCLTEMKGTDKELLFQQLYNFITKDNVM